MRVAVITGPGRVELRNEPVPALGPQDVRVNIGACGLCTMERRLYAGEKTIYPVAPGHEVVGRVIEVGDLLSGMPGEPVVGDLVIMDLLTRCGVCRACRRGASAVCESPQGGQFPDGTISMGAGLAEQMTLPGSHAWPIKDTPVAHAAMGEPLACVAHSLRRSGLRAGDHVAIIGAGYMGRLHLALARLAGASSVGMVDPSEVRLRQAEAAGADWTASPEDAARSAELSDVIFVTAGGPGSLELGIELSRERGTVVLYGAFPKDLTVSVGPDHLHHAEISLVGAFSHEPEDWRTAAGLLSSGALEASLEPLVTARFGLDDVGKALELAVSTPVFRVLVDSNPLND